MTAELRRAVAEAVDVVNRHAGRTTVHLRFVGDAAPVDFVANSARLQGGTFEFQAGYEKYGGSIEELSDISTELIGR